MNDVPAGIIAIGTRLCFDGGLWEVAEVTATGVVLRDALGGLRQAGISHLLADPSARLLDVPAGQAALSPPGTSGLTMTEAEELRALAGHVQEVLTGYQRGSEALALPGEPRPQYAPGTPKLERCRAKADELGVSVMTLRRMIWRFEAGGPEGLVDQRGQRRKDPLAGADPRWLDMARRVLAEYAQASKPTQDLILAEVAARLDAERGDGAVPVPKPTRARALLREITKGTFAFGGTKAKREIAGRPAAPYGRLRAMPPGEYLLLDTTRLDVFAMDPVTLRWVQAELTIAMDLYDRCVTGLRLTPVSTKAVDAAAMLFESVRPLPEPARRAARCPPALPRPALPGDHRRRPARHRGRRAAAAVGRGGDHRGRPRQDLPVGAPDERVRPAGHLRPAGQGLPGHRQGRSRALLPDPRRAAVGLARQPRAAAHPADARRL